MFSRGHTFYHNICKYFSRKRLYREFFLKYCWLIISHFLVLSTDAISSDRPNWEDLISPLFIAAKTFVRRFEPKVGWLFDSFFFFFMLLGCGLCCMLYLALWIY